MIVNRKKTTDINFGSDKINEFFKKLDKSVQLSVVIMNRSAAIKLLEIMSNPNIQQVYDGLTDKEKDDLNKMTIENKYLTLKKMLDEKVANTTFVLSEKKEDEKFKPRTPSIESHDDDESFSKFSPKTPSTPPPREPETFVPEEPPNDVPDEFVEKEEEEQEKEDKRDPQVRFDNIVKIFYDNNRSGELEVKFGTKGIKSITKNNYDNVVRKLKSAGFTSVGEENGDYYLRVNCEFLDSTTGRFKMSNIRTDIRGLPNIQEFCKTNEIKHLPHNLFVEHMTKGPMFINNQKIFPVDFDDFNFRITYSDEKMIRKMGVTNNIVENWRKSKKEFRFINRVSFKHADYPFNFDISIVKYGNKMTDKFGRQNRGPIIRVYTLEESNVLHNEEVYEIELEIDNKRVGPGTRFNTPQLIVDSLRKGIKYVLSGIQGTNYPISYPEQKAVSDSYLKMIWKDEFSSIKYISSRYFIGPNSYTLQMENISAIDANSNAPNIRKGFVVTEKADGERHLLFISHNGKIYLINTNMDIIFTGAKTDNEKCWNSLLDGELIVHDKFGKFINLYAAFDIYYINKEDVRAYTFLQSDTEKESYKSRYNLLQFIRQNLNAVSITNTKKMVGKKGKDIPEFNKPESLLSPLRFSVKEFFPNNSKQTIFEGCMQILQKEKENRFEYNTDGLIFTHAFYGVGSGEIGKAGPKEKITWDYSFKWKPPQYNTIDFLVTTEKGPNGDDIVKPLFEEGQNTSEVAQFNEYKKVILRCGFREKKDGFINPCQDIIDDNLPQYQVRYEDKQENDYIPQRFYPTEPYDPNAGLCNIMLRMDGSGGKKMFSEENQVFEDNTIVEFRYDLTKEEGWKWIPLRVRYDKTARLRKGEKEYGNAYHVCNSNWKSIHPTGRITADMLSTGQNIPDLSVSEDKYYNTPAGKFKTESMKQFHNLYVKKHLIVGVGKQGDTLIDFACGKAGDLSKWIAAKLSFVFGVDISKDNLENRLDGACARFLKARRNNKHVPYALFVNGNSAYNIKDGSAMLNEKAKQITAAVFGNGNKKIGPGVDRQYGKGADGFQISSCQFAVHYFFENPDTLRGFMKNLAECTKHNGYFIGTAYDGKLVFNELKKTKTGESIQIIEDGRKIWEITKGYGSDTFEDDSSSIGYRIDVFQESINQTISEYLVNFDYFNRVMSAYGFEIVSREEANEMGLPEGTGLFSELFLNMLDEITRNKFKAKDYGDAPMMTSIEKKISFLNRFFVYKKVRIVNTDAIELELGEYNETAALRDKKETKHAVKIAEEIETKMTSSKVRKLSKKMLLIPATEAIDEQEEKEEKGQEEKGQEEKEQKQKKSKNIKVKADKSTKKVIIIESDEED